MLQFLILHSKIANIFRYIFLLINFIYKIQVTISFRNITSIFLVIKPTILKKTIKGFQGQFNCNMTTLNKNQLRSKSFLKDNKLKNTGDVGLWLEGLYALT